VVENLFFPSETLTKAQLKRKKRSKHALPELYSSEDVMFRDVRDFLGAEWVDGYISRDGDEEYKPPEGLGKHVEVELRVGAFTVSGGLSL
jgi:tRNA (uracil-5-)-methyltransferase